MGNQKLVEMTYSSFIFLEKEFSFKLDNVEQTGNSLNTLRYRRKIEDLGIDIEVESMDIGVYVLLVSLENGREPDGYYVNKEGEKVREHLVKYLQQENKLPIGYLEETRKKYRELQKVNSEGKRYLIIQEILDFNASLLKNHINFIIKNHHIH